MRTRPPSMTRRGPNRSIRPPDSGAPRPKARMLTRDGQRDAGAIPAELGLERFDEHARRRAHAGRGEQDEERDDHDEPGVGQPTKHACDCSVTRPRSASQLRGAIHAPMWCRHGDTVETSQADAAACLSAHTPPGGQGMRPSLKRVATTIVAGLLLCRARQSEAGPITTDNGGPERSSRRRRRWRLRRA